MNPKHRKEYHMADETESQDVVSDEQLDDGEVVSAPLGDDAPVEDAPADEAPAEEEHELKPHVVEHGKYTYYGGWTCQSGSAYNGVELSKEHPTKNG